MCVNDIITSGANPLFFLDYISTGRLDIGVMEQVVSGIAEGCRRGGCSLIGGETAEHPGVMAEDDYDLAGFTVGVVDRIKIIDGKNINPGDLLVGLASSGIHSNGYSLVRKLFLEQRKYPLDKHVESLGDTLGNILLTPTRIYTAAVRDCLDEGIAIKGIIHVTGGGFHENIPRILPDTCAVHIDSSQYEVHPIFSMIRQDGSVDDREMYSTFNMGIGMILIVSPDSGNDTVMICNRAGEKSSVIGTVTVYEKEKVIIS